MKTTRLLSAACGAVLTLCAATAQAQMFKWVDAKGVVHYSDTAPPASQKTLELKAFASGPTTVALPFELAQAVRDHPVVLYTTAECLACDEARALLQGRGIPYAEKTVSSAEDQDSLKQAGSPGQLPLVLVGRIRLVGFEAGAWNAALSNAAYPAQRTLPSNYEYASPEPAAPRGPSPEQLARAAAAKAAAANAAAAQAEAARRAKPPPANAAPNFQF